MNEDGLSKRSFVDDHPSTVLTKLGCICLTDFKEEHFCNRERTMGNGRMDDGIKMITNIHLDTIRQAKH